MTQVNGFPLDSEGQRWQVDGGRGDLLVFSVSDLAEEMHKHEAGPGGKASEVFCVGVPPPVWHYYPLCAGSCHLDPSLPLQA